MGIRGGVKEREDRLMRSPFVKTRVTATMAPAPVTASQCFAFMPPSQSVPEAAGRMMAVPRSPSSVTNAHIPTPTARKAHERLQITAPRRATDRR